MLTLIARLCALCAVGALMQMMLDETERSFFGMIGGLLMLHLVIQGAQGIVTRALAAQNLSGMFEALLR